MNFAEEFTTLIVAIQSAKIDFAICGGLAMGLHGIPRYTKDIDLLVLSKDLTRVVSLAAGCGYVLEEGVIPLGNQAGHPFELHRMPKTSGEDFLLLILLPVVPIFEDVWASRGLFVWQYVPIPVVSAPGLAKMKRLAARLQDLADIEALAPMHEKIHLRWLCFHAA